MEEFEVYLFDFDGTLVNSRDSLLEVFKRAYKSVGIEVGDEHILRLMRVQLQQGYKELGAPEDEESVKLFASEIIRLLDIPEITALVKNYDDVKQALFVLKSMGKTLGIVTSNNQKHVRDVLRHLDIDENLFSVIVGNKETKLHKPNPDPILKALELLNISNEGVCYVGDGLDDMRCAANANVYPILLDRLDEYGDSNHIVIKTLDELY